MVFLVIFKNKTNDESYFALTTLHENKIDLLSDQGQYQGHSEVF